MKKQQQRPENRGKYHPPHTPEIPQIRTKPEQNVAQTETMNTLDKSIQENIHL